MKKDKFGLLFPLLYGIHNVEIIALFTMTVKSPFYFLRLYHLPAAAVVYSTFYTTLFLMVHK